MGSNGHHNVDDLIENLVEEAQQAGHANLDQILEHLPKLSEDAAFVEELVNRLDDAGVDVIEHKAPSQPKIHEDGRLAYIASDDAITLYFREVGTVPLLTREARIIELRYGLRDGRPYTLKEVGERFGLTRERIRQIEQDALRRLRSPRRTRKLRPTSPRDMEEIQCPISLGLDCQIQAMPAGFGNPGRAGWDNYFFPSHLVHVADAHTVLR
ncbi:MAG: RNA polymerase sigma factor SigA [Anaerolineales bacterium]|nr:RNA polymerase sigma factor SigA [Anaerolineales bacterium]